MKKIDIVSDYNYYKRIRVYNSEKDKNKDNFILDFKMNGKVEDIIKYCRLKKYPVFLITEF